MLARVLSAALSAVVRPFATKAEVNGIEAFPVEVEVNCGWDVPINVIFRAFSAVAIGPAACPTGRHFYPV